MIRDLLYRPLCAPDDEGGGGATGPEPGSNVASDLERVSAGADPSVESAVAEALQLRPFLKDEYGFEYGDDFDEEKIIRDIAAKAKQVREYEQNSRLAQERIRGLEYQITQGQRQPAPAPEQRPMTAAEKREYAGLLAHWNKVPEWDPDWRNSLKYDEQGNIVPAHSGVRPDLPQVYEQYQKWQRSAMETFLHNPLEFIYDAIAQSGIANQLREAWQHDTQAHLARVQHITEIEKLYEKNASWMLTLNEDGQPIGVTEDGAAVVRALEELEAENPNIAPAKLFGRAKEVASARLGHAVGKKKAAAEAGSNGSASNGNGKGKPAPAPAAPAGPPTHRERRLATLKGANRMPERGGSRSTEHSPTTKLNRLNLVEEALADAREKGVIPRESE